MLFEAGVDILLLLILVSVFQELLGGFGLVGGGASIHDTHVMNTFLPLIPKVYDEEIPLHISLVLRRVPFELFLVSMCSATCVDFGVVMHVHGVEVLTCKFRDPITELVEAHRDETSLLSVKGVADVKFHATYIAMVC